MRRSIHLGLLVAALGGTAPPLHAQVPDRSAPPELGPPPRLTLPPIRRHQLSNGLQIMLLEKHNVPVVQVNLVVRGGSAYDPSGRIGLATMTADMMDEGAGSRDALELADAVDFLGAQIGATAGVETMSVSMFTPTSKLAEALPLMADIALRPTFPGAELERKRTSRLTTLLQWHDEPSAVADVLIDRAVFGDHPYGNSSLGNEASIRTVTTDDLRAFHGTYFRPNNAVLIVVGDITLDGMLPMLQEAFGAWERAQVPSSTVRAPRQVASREILLVDKPDAAQSEIRIGRVGVSRGSDDYYALQVMNTILGGSFTSRLNQNLREDKGYTYGASSYFGFWAQPGPFGASSAVQTDATAAALREFFSEFDGIRRPVPADELERAKNYVALRFPASFGSVRGIAGNLDDLWVYGLPDDYFSQYVDRILGVTQRQVRDAATRHIAPDRMIVVVVGDLSRIEQEVRDLDLGAVRVLTVDDVLGPVPELGGN